LVAGLEVARQRERIIAAQDARFDEPDRCPALRGRRVLALPAVNDNADEELVDVAQSTARPLERRAAA
jgi:hypothetical protein